MSTLSDRDALLGRVREAADALKSYFGARRVILFGSLAEGQPFTCDSDVDLAAEGLDPFDRWDAWWLCEELIGRPVDLLPIECADASLLEGVQEHGVELHPAVHRPSSVVRPPSTAATRSLASRGVQIR